MHLSSVLLPDPFSPMSPKVSPAGISIDTSSSAMERLVAHAGPCRMAIAFSDWLRSW